jgi:hypothetical protein
MMFSSADMGPTTVTSMEFYSTTAQVIPVLLLALGWDSGYLKRVQDRVEYPRRWPDSGIRAWGTAMALASLVGEAAMVLVLADVVDPGPVWKGLGLMALGALSVTVTVRLITDIRAATDQSRSTPQRTTGQEPKTVADDRGAAH